MRLTISGAVRAASYTLASWARVPVELLGAGVSDPSAPVRLTAITLGIAGEAPAADSLVAELARQPSERVIKALTMIGDENAILYLSQCAENHHALADTVLDALREMNGTRAQRQACHLHTGSPASEDGGA